jgi:hypothetical protein
MLKIELIIFIKIDNTHILTLLLIIIHVLLILLKLIIIVIYQIS